MPDEDFSCLLKEEEGERFEAHELGIHRRVVLEAASLGQRGEVQMQCGAFRDEGNLAGEQMAEEALEDGGRWEAFRERDGGIEVEGDLAVLKLGGKAAAQALDDVVDFGGWGGCCQIRRALEPELFETV